MNPKYLPGTLVSYKDGQHELITTVKCVHRYYYSENVYSDTYSIEGTAGTIREEDLKPIKFCAKNQKEYSPEKISDETI